MAWKKDWTYRLLSLYYGIAGHRPAILRSVPFTGIPYANIWILKYVKPV